ncbi:MAG: hypothetical protein AAFX56_01995 [Pseudomonadota bacterium]
MVKPRVFYITQESLTVYRKGELDTSLRFPDSDQGLRDFDAYLAEHSEQPSIVLLDVIEEVFLTESVPKLASGDRRALMTRRARRKFPRTPYRFSVFAGNKVLPGNDDTAVHSAVSNHELLECWLQFLTRHKVPLRGIHSVSLLAAEVLPRLRKLKGPVLFLTHHQGDKLRQVFLRDGYVMSARLSQCPRIDSADYPAAVNQEIDRSRRYLERSRLLAGMEELHVCMVASAAVAEAVANAFDGESPLRLHVVGRRAAAARLGLTKEPSPGHLEAFYLAHSTRRAPRHNYAVSGETRYWQMHRLRQAIIGSAVAASVVCSVLAGILAGSAWLATDRSQEIERQLAQLSSTLREDNKSYSPIHAGSHEMKLAVDTGDYILANRLPAPWVLLELSRVLEDYPDVQLVRLNWSAGEQAAGNRQTPATALRRGGTPASVPVSRVASVDARFTAVLAGYDKDLRRAFARIEALAVAFEKDSRFNRADVLEYPIDARPAASVSGEIGGTSAEQGMRFEIRLRYVPEDLAGTPNEVIASGGRNDSA